jgi:hypothetical protein
MECSENNVIIVIILFTMSNSESRTFQAMRLASSG